jgi:hypothetical protein
MLLQLLGHELEAASLELGPILLGREILNRSANQSQLLFHQLMAFSRDLGDQHIQILPRGCEAIPHGLVEGSPNEAAREIVFDPAEVLG